MRTAVLITSVTVATALSAGCSASNSPNATTGSSTVGINPQGPSTSAVIAAPLTTTPEPVTTDPAPAGCEQAPAAVVGIIDKAFTNGEHLDAAQAVAGPQSATYVGGNIVSATGERVSSQDTWVQVDGQVYALTTDARRNTLLPDGRDIPAIGSQWPAYDDRVGTCVGAATPK